VKTFKHIGDFTMRYLVLLLTAMASLNVAFANTDEQTPDAVATETQTPAENTGAETASASEVEAREVSLN
jgi:hypothetical protein